MQLTCIKGASTWLSTYEGFASGQSDLGFDQTLEWFKAYVDHVLTHADNALMLAVADDQGELVVGLPLLASASERFHIRQVSALSNYYTSLYEPIFSKQQQLQTDAIDTLVAGLADGFLGWDEISLEPLADDSVFFQNFRRSIESAGYPYMLGECFSNWYLDVDGRSYDEYECSLPSKLRNTLKRKQRRLERELEYTIRLVRADDPDLEQLIQDYEAVYLKSWKTDESHPEFIRAIMRAFADSGWLRLGLMYIEGQPVAAQLWFVKDSVASIYKLSYDERYAKYSIGTILTAAMMRHVIDEDQVGLVDFLTGNDSYKRDWMSHHRERYRIRIYNKQTWRGRALALWNMRLKPMIGKTQG